MILGKLQKLYKGERVLLYKHPPCRKSGVPLTKPCAITSFKHESSPVHTGNLEQQHTIFSQSSPSHQRLQYGDTLLKMTISKGITRTQWILYPMGVEHG